MQQHGQPDIGVERILRIARHVGKSPSKLSVAVDGKVMILAVSAGPESWRLQTPVGPGARTRLLHTMLLSMSNLEQVCPACVAQVKRDRTRGRHFYSCSKCGHEFVEDESGAS